MQKKWILQISCYHPTENNNTVIYSSTTLDDVIKPQQSKISCVVLAVAG